MLEMFGESYDPVRVETSRRNQWTQEEEVNRGRRGSSRVSDSDSRKWNWLVKSESGSNL